MGLAGVFVLTAYLSCFTIPPSILHSGVNASERACLTIPFAWPFLGGSAAAFTRRLLDSDVLAELLLFAALGI